MSDTPQTNTEVEQYDGEATEYVDANFARRLERENAKLRDDRDSARRFLTWIRLNCRVVFYPPTPAYPVEHAMGAKKDQWDELYRLAGF